jgi:formate dehydrogenase maturation protein FdhE
LVAPSPTRHTTSADDVRTLVIKGDVDKLRREHGTERIDEDVLAKDYREKVTHEAASRYDAETKAEDKAIVAQLKTLRERTLAEMVRAGTLRAEAERVNPDKAPQTWVNASLLDAFTADREERWLERYADNEQRSSSAIRRPMLVATRIREAGRTGLRTLRD